MKSTIGFIATILLGAALCAQEKPSPRPSTGFFLSYDGTKFREVGARYWLSDAIAVFGNMSFAYSQLNSDNQSRINQSDGRTISLGGGAHVAFHENNNSRFYAIAGMNYLHFGGNERMSNQTGLNNYATDITQFDFHIGGGVEYLVAENLSLSAHYTMHYLHESSFGPDASRNITQDVSDRFDLGQARLLLSFYF